MLVGGLSWASLVSYCLSYWGQVHLNYRLKR